MAKDIENTYPVGIKTVTLKSSLSCGKFIVIIIPNPIQEGKELFCLWHVYCIFKLNLITSIIK